MELELLAWGYGLVEGPRTDPDNNLYFSDIPGGGVYRRSPAGAIETLIPERKSVGGIALHAAGGVVVSGPDVVHWRDGEMRVLLSLEGVKAWNDLQPDQAGNIYVGCIRRDMEAPRGTDERTGECYRIGTDGSVTELYGGIAVTNGIGFSPDGATIYHADSLAKGIVTHDVAPDGSIANRRLIGNAAFTKGIPDGLCVDADGNLWVAHVGGRRVVRLDPAGNEIGEVPVPAKAVTSCAFGGPDWSDLYIVTADNLDDPDKGGSIFRTRPGVAGLPTPLARV